MTARPTFLVALADETATATLMADLALLLGAGDVVALSGDLGAGKTAAARALVRYFADDDAFHVPSPTFMLVQTFDVALPIVHADLYRVTDPGELDELGLFPLSDTALTVIEWPERAGESLPDDRVAIALSHRPAQGPSARSAEITGYGKAGAIVARLAALRIFLDKAGYGDAIRRRMTGDASTRSYARLHRGDRVDILMNMPRRPDGPVLENGKTYSASVHLAEDIRPFVAIDEGLRAQGFSAPAIHRADLDAGFCVLEDFGGEGVVEHVPPVPIMTRYEAAADLLASLHRRRLPDRLMMPGEDAGYTIPAFDLDAMLIEVSLMPQWYLPDQHKLDAAAAKTYETLWRLVLTPLTVRDAPRTWMLRDFHSPNILWLEDRGGGIGSVGVIDFQDTVMGPPAYDLVSLLQDARIDVPEAVELALLGRYIRVRREHEPEFDVSRFAESYAILSAQRNTRLLGTFARLAVRDGKTRYLKHQPRIWTYLRRSLAHPALSDLRTWFTAHVTEP